jgi:hypothetical protein
MIAYHIDAKARTITPFTYRSGADFTQYLPGGICIGQVFHNGDVLYVDDEGLLHPATVAFGIKARRDGQPMMSDGILTGPDDGDDTLPPRFSVTEFLDEIEWLEVDAALDWFRARSAEAAVTINSGGQSTVLSDWGDFLEHMTTASEDD